MIDLPHESALTTDEMCNAIAEYSQRLAQAAEVDLSAPVVHCPGWTVADLVAHLSEVHSFWSAIAEHRLAQPPEADSRQGRPADSELIASFLAGSRHLVDVLRSADQSATVWTWAPGAQNIAFVTRHQVQEAAVHCWDAEHARGADFAVGSKLAADAVEEFLTYSVSTVDDPAPEPPNDLAATLVLTAVDASTSWVIDDGGLPGTLTFQRQNSPAAPGAADAVTISATASDLLLWLYRRLELDAGGPDSAAAILRFRALTSTD